LHDFEVTTGVDGTTPVQPCPLPLPVLTIKLVRKYGVKQEFIVGWRACGAKSFLPTLTRLAFGCDYKVRRFRVQFNSISRPVLLRSFPKPVVAGW
jgi:hypothetical protein